MLKRFTYALLALTLVFASCTDEKTVYVPTPVPGPGAFASGIIYYGTTYEDLTFYDPAKKMFYPGNVFKSVNGQTVGTDDGMNGGINDVYIYDGKAYFFTPVTSEEGENEGMARIAVADSETFELEKSIYAEGFDMTNMGYIYNIMVVNENKFYVTYCPQYESGIRVITVNPQSGVATISDDNIQGTGGLLGVDGPATPQRMTRSGNYIVAACGNKIQFISTSTDQVAHTIAMNDVQTVAENGADRQVADVLMGRDGYLYAIIAGQCDKSEREMWWGGMGPWFWDITEYESAASIMKIDPATFTVIYEEALLDEGEQLDIKAVMEANGAVASLTSDEILYTVGNASGLCDVYAFNYTTKANRLVADPTGGSFGKYMAADKNGNVYCPIITNQYKNCEPQVYRISGENERVSDIEARFVMANGDGGFVSTYLFE